MIQQMRLGEEIFEKIKSGKKTIELRLLDEKRKVLKVGDIIDFGKRPSLHERMSVKIVELKKYKTFEEVYEDCDLKDLGYEEDVNKEDFVNNMYQHYNEDEVGDYDILVIKFKKLEN